MAADSDGDFVIVWQSNGSPGPDSSSLSVQGQRYASDGSTLGGQFQINTYTTAGQVDAVVAADPDGDFVVVWESSGSPGDDNFGLSVQVQVSSGPIQN